MGLFLKKARSSLNLVFLVGGFLGIPALLFASEQGGHHGSISDLIAPFVNFFILATLIIVKSRKKIQEHFESFSQMVQAGSERAEAKSKEAQIKYDMYERKIKECDQECEGIYRNSENELSTQIKNYRMEMQKKTEKLRSDAVQRLEKEKADHLQKLNESFLDSIIHRASVVIDGDKDVQTKVTKKILKVINI